MDMSLWGPPFNPLSAQRSCHSSESHGNAQRWSKGAFLMATMLGHSSSIYSIAINARRMRRPHNQTLSLHSVLLNLFNSSQKSAPTLLPYGLHTSLDEVLHLLTQHIKIYFLVISKDI